MASDKVIVIGGGLAGLSAAHTILERGGRVLLLDKQPFLGGNSTKATSGINAALTNQQVTTSLSSHDKYHCSQKRIQRRRVQPTARPIIWNLLPYWLTYH